MQVQDSTNQSTKSARAPATGRPLATHRLKKWPWKDAMRRPLEQRMRMTASHAVGRVRLCVTSAASLGPSRAAEKPVGCMQDLHGPVVSS